jgi:hypothetical protein
MSEPAHDEEILDDRYDTARLILSTILLIFPVKLAQDKTTHGKGLGNQNDSG